MEVTCAKCNSVCQVDGEYPKFFAWCDECDDYADCDMSEFATEWFAGLVDYTYDRMRDDMMDKDSK